MSIKKTRPPGRNQEASLGITVMAGSGPDYTSTSSACNRLNCETGRIVAKELSNEPWRNAILPGKPVVASGPLEAAAMNFSSCTIADLTRAELVLAISLLVIAWEKSGSTLDSWVQVGETRLLRVCALSRSTFYRAKRCLVERGLLEVHRENSGARCACDYRLIFKRAQPLAPAERALAYGDMRGSK